MLKKVLVFSGVVIAGAYGLMVFCSNPSNPEPDKIIGVWVGDTIRQNIGAQYPDTFGITLRITETRYTLIRGNAEFGSSGVIADSSRVVGTWTKNAAGDSVSFSSSTGIDSCYKYDFGTGTWGPCTGGAPDYLDCPAPFTMKIDITGTTWRAYIPNFKDPAEFFTFYLRKQ